MRRMKDRKQTSKPAMLNLVSLMDIFTILVFFLMLNSSEVEVLDVSSNIKLPDSVAEQRPGDRVVISINRDDVIVQGSRVASVEEVLSAPQPLIKGLQTALESYAKTQRARSVDFDGAVTILGDRTLPYELLKRIMRTCQQAEFTQIALAVNQVKGEGV